MAKIYLVRHGLTDLNEDHRLRGWLDVDLSTKGYEQAEDLGKRLSKVPLSLIYSSDLQRAQHTSEPIKRSTGAKVVSLSSLRPLNFGLYNGRKLDEIKQNLDDLTSRWEGNPNAKAPLGESFSDFQGRQQSFLEGLLNNLEPEENIAVVAHLRNAAYAHAYAENDRRPLEGEKVKLISKEVQPPGSFTILHFDHNTGKLHDGTGDSRVNKYGE